MPTNVDDIAPATAAVDMAKLRDALRVATLLAVRRAGVSPSIISKIEEAIAEEPPGGDLYRQPSTNKRLRLTESEYTELGEKLRASSSSLRLDALGVRVDIIDG